MAIHDREYASPPQSFDQFRWRVQYLAELGIGRLLRREQQSEQEAMNSIMEKLR